MRTLMPALTVVMTLVLVLACSQTEEPSAPLTSAPYFKTLEEGQKVAAEENKYLIVDFYTDW